MNRRIEFSDPLGDWAMAVSESSAWYALLPDHQTVKITRKGSGCAVPDATYAAAPWSGAFPSLSGVSVSVPSAGRAPDGRGA